MQPKAVNAQSGTLLSTLDGVPCSAKHTLATQKTPTRIEVDLTAVSGSQTRKNSYRILPNMVSEQKGIKSVKTWEH